ncbi:hypothetical protein HPP92_001296 [Vanilla planifolia]|uniref:Uncharacterized protein n=1 Tax=Vanilla planifolia TaxID=51239 RepID=A0A835S4C5_VANPL|nr:hypothetical protein HPP92_001296 [Vanilla planifolia]
MTSSAFFNRRNANYQPTIWHDSYIQSLQIGFTEEKYSSRRIELMEDVRSLIRQPSGVIQQLELFDTLRQIGIAYHFEMEIKDLMNSMVSSTKESIRNIVQDNLHGIFLLFRILREYGIITTHFSYLHVKDIITSLFKEKTTGFNSNIEYDVNGLLSMYEASYLAMEGEDELDDARKFAIEQLSKKRRSLISNSSLAEQIDYSLDLPLHWRMPRLHARWFINFYERQEDMNPTLLKLAKLDFNIVQSIYKKELKEESRWWTNLGLVGGHLPFVRDRLVEHYLLAMGLCFQPEFWRCRKAISRINCLVTTIDDIYDIYGTLEELETFTNAVKEWKLPTCQQIPEYMLKPLVALFDTMNSIASIYSQDKGLDILTYLKRVWSDLCNAYLVESRWYYDGYIPTLDEYLENALVSISGICVLTAAYYLSEDLSTNALDACEFFQSVVRSSCLICRLYNDLGTSTDEMERGDISKSIQSYMKESNVSELVAREYIKDLISRSWKKLNGEALNTCNDIKSFRKALLDMPRAAQCFYQHGDGHGIQHLETKNRIISLIIEPIPH